MKRWLMVVAGMGTALGTVVAQAQMEPYKNVALSPEQRAHDLVSRMTLEEKAQQSINTAPAIPRLGVPAYDYWNEGLHGVARSGYATLFPQAMGMAATWDAPLLGKVGEVISTEARAKYNEAVRHDIHSIYFGLTVWSPNINIFRDPRWGRGQETYGEDPYLTSMMGLNFIRGIQGPDPLHPRAIATPKHFAVHSGPESERHRFNVEPSRHDLWDTYLPQFRTAIVDAKAGSIMCSYNAVDGKPACASDFLLQKVLRDEWKFNGFVTSDCGAVDDFYMSYGHHFSKDKLHADAAALAAGTDTNCGNTYLALDQAVKEKLVPEADLDRALERLFTARYRLGLFDAKGSPYNAIPFREDRAPAHLALSARTSRESMVLLKNDGILPLAPGKYKKVLVVGPNAVSLVALEGNYNAIAKNPEMPLDSLRKELAGARVMYAQGSPYAQGVMLPVPRTMLHPSASSSQEGLKAEYFNAGADATLENAFSGRSVVTRVDPQIDFDWAAAAPADGVSAASFGVRWTGTITAIQPGDQKLMVELAECYPCQDRESFVVKIDGKAVSSFATKVEESRQRATPEFTVALGDTKPHALEIDYVHHAPIFGAGLTLKWMPPTGVLQQQAVEAAKDADLVVAMIGLSSQLEGEEMKIAVKGFAGGDRTDIQLPDAQQELLNGLAALNKPTVLVLLNGSALAVDASHANAVLEAWYPGEFGGAAIAETLTGKNNPAGRLPVTFYTGVDELPPFSDYSMKNRTYRYFTGKPQYGFGYGLSYTTFAYSGLKLSTTNVQAGEPLTATVTVKNTGSRAGDEVAQVYLLPPASGNGGLSPHKQLAGFERVHLAPGESRTVTFQLAPRWISEVDAEGTRAMQAGEYTLSVGGAQPGDPLAPSAAQTATFTINGTAALPQ